MSVFQTTDGLTIGIGRTDLPGIIMKDMPRELEPVVRAACEPGNTRMTANAFVGLLLPYHIHNLNNILVGVLGNAELASMFLPDNVNRAVPKVREAVDSAGVLTRFLRDLSETTHPSLERAAVSASPMTRLTRFVSLACGRSIDTSALTVLDSAVLPGLGDPAAAYGALLGAGAWSVLSLGGTGEVAGFIDRGYPGIRWKRPHGAGEPMLPGSEMARTVISAAGGLAGRSGCLLRVEQVSGLEGSAVLEEAPHAG